MVATCIVLFERVVFIWAVSKVDRIYFSFALLRLVIGLNISHHFLIQSDTHTHFPAIRVSGTYKLQGLIGSMVLLWSANVIMVLVLRDALAVFILEDGQVDLCEKGTNTSLDEQVVWIWPSIWPSGEDDFLRMTLSSRRTSRLKPTQIGRSLTSKGSGTNKVNVVLWVIKMAGVAC